MKLFATDAAPPLSRSRANLPARTCGDRRAPDAGAAA